jgi:hypothetical protein
MHSERARLIRGGTDDPALTVAPHYNGAAAQMGLVILLYRSVEGIHIQVQYAAIQGIFHGCRHNVFSMYGNYCYFGSIFGKVWSYH